MRQWVVTTANGGRVVVDAQDENDAMTKVRARGGSPTGAFIQAAPPNPAAPAPEREPAAAPGAAGLTRRRLQLADAACVALGVLFAVGGVWYAIQLADLSGVLAAYWGAGALAAGLLRVGAGALFRAVDAIATDARELRDRLGR